MGDTSIQWTDKTWNPIRARRLDTGKVGWHCEIVSEECSNCYSDTFNGRNLPNGGTALDYVRRSRDLVKIVLDREMLMAPFKWRKPQMVFVCSMTDLFADFVPDEMIEEMLAVMASTPHTYQILTKRPERMRTFMDDRTDEGLLRWAMIEGAAQRIHHERTGDDPSLWLAVHAPLPNVWLGVSAGKQEYADKRIPLLLQTPAAVRFVSYEPALGPVDFTSIPVGRHINANVLIRHKDHPFGSMLTPDARIDWVIVGGESGSKARAFDIQRARSIVEQCKAAGVPVFVKQLGRYPHDVLTFGYSPTPIELKDRKGGDMDEWPADLRVREFPGISVKTA